jgi:hypothetical protein
LGGQQLPEMSFSEEFSGDRQVSNAGMIVDVISMAESRLQRTILQRKMWKRMNEVRDFRADQQHESFCMPTNS